MHDRSQIVQADTRRRPRLTRRVQSAHGYEVNAVATGAGAEGEAAKEIAIMRSLCHPNIVRLTEVIGKICCRYKCCIKTILLTSFCQ